MWSYKGAYSLMLPYLFLMVIQIPNYPVHTSLVHICQIYPKPRVYFIDYLTVK